MLYHPAAFLVFQQSLEAEHEQIRSSGPIRTNTVQYLPSLLRPPQSAEVFRFDYCLEASKNLAQGRAIQRKTHRAGPRNKG